MLIEQAAQKSIEGGYLGGKTFAVYRAKSRHFVYQVEDYVMPKLTKSISEALIDPDFWRCLAKGMGWKKYVWTSYKGYDDHFLTHFTDDETYDVPWEKTEYAQRHITFVYYWHCFIDHLAERKNIESYFETL